jgi:uncharacterized membrane protein YphA (DoxX/SURF4 family)
MSTAPSADQHRPTEIIALLVRWLLGGLFVYLGVSKLRHSAEFLTFVRQQIGVSNPSLSVLVATTAPWLEVLYGLLLITGIAREALAVAARWWLGLVFVYMGLHKALPNPETFLKLVREYDIVSNHVLLNSIGAALPWFEVYCGLLLLAGVAVRGAALNLIVMLVPFTLVVLKRALDIAAADHIRFCAVKFDCGCGAGEVLICHKLVENSGLLLLSAWLLLGYGRRLSLRYCMLRSRKTPRRPDPALKA